MQERPERKSKYYLDPIKIEHESSEYEDSENDLSDQSVSGESKDLLTEDDQPVYKQHLKLHDDIVQLQLSKTLIGKMVDDKIREIKRTESKLILQETTRVKKPSSTETDSHIKKIQGLKAKSILNMEEELNRLKKLDKISDSYLKYLE